MSGYLMEISWDRFMHTRSSCRHTQGTHAQTQPFFNAQTNIHAFLFASFTHTDIHIKIKRREVVWWYGFHFHFCAGFHHLKINSNGTSLTNIYIITSLLLARWCGLQNLNLRLKITYFMQIWSMFVSFLSFIVCIVCVQRQNYLTTAVYVEGKEKIKRKELLCIYIFESSHLISCLN